MSMRRVLLPRVRRRLLLGGLLGCAAKPAAPPADIVAYGRVWTGDSAKPWASAVATRGDTIVAVGDSADVRELIGPRTKVLSNGKAMVVPGLMDGHVHFIDGGFQLAGVDLRPARSPAEFIGRLKDYALERRPGEWIAGGDWDHESWPGSPLPTRQWIDSVTPNNPTEVDLPLVPAEPKSLRFNDLDGVLGEVKLEGWKD